nr:SAM-dependent methyltransferase [Candidatus Neomarinimicrobiota bacterium]
MNLNDSKIQDFINRQLHSTAADLMLQASKYPQWNMKAIAQQLTGKQIAQKKIPAWFKNDDILYPARISMEQCSSEETAAYKSS